MEPIIEDLENNEEVEEGVVSYECRNPQYSSPDNLAVDVEYNHPEFGWIPFTASLDDPEQIGRDIFAAALNGDYGVIATPVFEDIPVYIPESVSRAQGKAALLNAGLLEAVESYINGLVGEQKIRANLAFNETTEWRRDSPFLAQAASVLGLSEQQLDNLFLVASGIVL